MSAREAELTLERRPAQEMEAGEDALPIVILPDGIDVESLLEPEARGAPPAAAAEEPAGAGSPSLRRIEAEIQEEISLEGLGARAIFFMPRICKQAAAGILVLLGVLLYIGWGYYRLPLVVRPLHHLHSALRPSGQVGLLLGVAGAGTLLASLLYLARKALLSRGRFGSLQGWMGFHILTGLMGPAIALSHAAFVPTSALGFLLVGSMLVVVASGIVGRYIAVRFPRSLAGRELELDEIRGRLAVYRKKLVALGVDPTLLRLDLARPPARAPWLIASILRVLAGDRESRKELQRLRVALAARSSLRIEMELVLPLIRRLCWERQWLVRYGEFRRVMGSWRFFHRWLAIVLLAALLCHIVVGVRFGGLWILGGQR